MSDTFTLTPFEFATRELRTRFPFRYGIASMTDVPHLFVSVGVVRNGEPTRGLTAEGLPPKWFTKNPATTFGDDLCDMRRVIDHATRAATAIARQPISFFEFWQELSREQERWAQAEGLPPLLSNLGVSLCERAVLDGLARAIGVPVHVLVRENRLGLRLSEARPELAGIEVHHGLAEQPLERVFVRHTVGLTDPLTPADVAPGEAVEDGLPQDLESSVREYGLRYFKVKLSGESDRDRDRLRAVKRLLDGETGGDWLATVDGNENFRSFAAFREFWEGLSGDAALREFERHLLAVEQPVHRDHALSDEAGAALRRWPGHPPLIIDESDGGMADLPRALALGYAGTSHKNCKGIVKGLANACLLAAHRQRGERVILTGEDLCNLGPIALLQDLAMMSLLGIGHVERNGHHYYRGLSMWPREWQDAALRHHGDVFAPREAGFAALRIVKGAISLQSVNAAPFGVQPWFEPRVLQGEPAAAP